MVGNDFSVREMMGRSPTLFYVSLNVLLGAVRLLHMGGGAMC